jgi:hypothetical protein
MKRLLLIVTTAMLLLSSCSQADVAYQVGGIGGRFCVPAAYVIQRIPWIPASIPEGNGFAFAGCWRGGPSHPLGCGFPEAVQGGVVEPISTFRKEQWTDLDNKSPYKTVATDKGSLLESNNKGTLVVVSNNRDWLWYVWHKAIPLSGNRKPFLEGEDNLLAICQTNHVRLPGKAKRDAIFCERYIKGATTCCSTHLNPASACLTILKRWTRRYLRKLIGGAVKNKL